MTAHRLANENFLPSELLSRDGTNQSSRFGKDRQNHDVKVLNPLAWAIDVYQNANVRIYILFYTFPEFPHLTLEIFRRFSFIGLALSYYVQTYHC